MIRYVNDGDRRYDLHPVRVYARPYVEFQLIVEGTAVPTTHPPEEPPPEAPCLWVHSPESVYGWTDRAGGISRMVVFHFDDVHPILRKELRERPGLASVLDAADAERIQGWVPLARNVIRAPTNHGHLWAEHIKAELSLLAVRGQPERKPAKGASFAAWKVEQAIVLYRETLYEQLSVADIARRIGLSPTHLRRLFQQVKQQSPRTVFSEIRMQQARRLAAEGARSLSAVSDALGFSEPSAFSRAYRNRFGHAPRTQRPSMAGGPKLQASPRDAE